MFPFKEKSLKSLIAFCLINIKFIQWELTGKTFIVFVSLQMFIQLQRTWMYWWKALTHLSNRFDYYFLISKRSAITTLWIVMKAI